MKKPRQDISNRKAIDTLNDRDKLYAQMQTTGHVREGQGIGPGLREPINAALSAWPAEAKERIGSLTMHPRLPGRSNVEQELVTSAALPVPEGPPMMPAHVPVDKQLPMMPAHTPAETAIPQPVASHEENGGTQPRKDGDLLTNVAYPESMRGSYGYTEGNQNSMVPLGGWRSQNDMLADTARRKVTGTLSNGSRYTYFLKPGETEPAIPERVNSSYVNRDAVLQGANRSVSGTTVARFQHSDGLRSLAQKERDDAAMRRNAESFKVQQEARKLQLQNDLVEYFKDSDPDIAKSLMLSKGGTGAIPEEPEWKTFKTDSVGQDGTPVSHLGFYRTGRDGALEFKNAPNMMSMEQRQQLSTKAREQAIDEARDRAGVFSSDASDFEAYGGDRQKFIDYRTQELLSQWGAIPEQRGGSVRPVASQRMIDRLFSEIKHGNGPQAKKQFVEFFGYLPAGV